MTFRNGLNPRLRAEDLVLFLIHHQSDQLANTPMAVAQSAGA